MSSNANRKLPAKPSKSSKSAKMIDFAEYQNTDKLEKIQQDAFSQYEVGRAAIYKALALTYIWYELGKDTPGYLKKAFASFPNQTNSHNYAKAVRACLRLNAQQQAPTITKYKGVLTYLHSCHAELEIKAADAATVAVLTKTIKDAGGLDGCVKANAASGDQDESKVEKVRLTKEEVENRAKKYLSKKVKPLAQFALPAGLAPTESKLLIMVGRVSKDKAEVIDITIDDELVERFIRAA